MKSLLPFFLLTVLFADTKLGKPLELSSSMPVAEALSNGDTLTGKTVQVRGKVTEVCQMAGCWMAIADASAPQKMIRIKVEDGVIIFPKDAIGKTAIAEGTLTRQVLTKEEALKEAEHEAKEQSRKFNSKSVKHGSTTYEIRGTGAILLN